jgi:hypothetical protein
MHPCDVCLPSPQLPGPRSISNQQNPGPSSLCLVGRIRRNQLLVAARIRILTVPWGSIQVYRIVKSGVSVRGKYMLLVSRRDLIFAGVATGARALLPSPLFLLSSKLTNSTIQSGASSSGGPTEQTATTSYSTGVQAEILSLARNVLTKLFEGKTLVDLQSDADRLHQHLDGTLSLSYLPDVATQ